MLRTRLFFLVLSPLLCGGVLWHIDRTRTALPEPTLFWDDDARREVQSIVETRFVDPVAADRAHALFDEAMRGYVGSLDPFSGYVRSEDRPALDERTTGAFGGIGVRVAPSDGGLFVTAVRRDSPAERAGLEPGEVIESADGRALSGSGLDDLLTSIKGPVGSSVTLVVRGADGSARSVSVERAMVALDTVPAVRTIAGEVPVGYVRIAQFSDTTAADAREAVAKCLRDGARAFVLDLRQNLGGTVRPAEAVASMFLPVGTVVCRTRRRDGADVHATTGAGFTPDTDVPLILLVDERTASASEILAGCLQDHGRAVLVGERTWGKFLVQTLVDAPSAGAIVQLTTSRFESPRGRSAQRPGPDETLPGGQRPALGGLVPDVRVPFRSDRERELLRATFAQDTGPRWRSLARPDGARGAAEPPPDAQLAAALLLLRGGAAPPEPVPVRP